MAISAFPAALQSIIQTGYLERRFEQALRATLAYRQVADREGFPNRTGETITKTRAGLLAVATTPLSPQGDSGNNNFDSGMSVGTPFSVEQYILGIQSYGFTLDLNVVTEKVGIASRFVQNAVVLGEQAARTMDTLCANALFDNYMGGNTRLRTTATSATQTVDDVRGFFQTLNSKGQPVPVSASNPLTVLINGASFTVTGVQADGNAPSQLPTYYSNLSFSGAGSNVSTAPGGYSGVLTLSASCTGTAAQPVVAATAPVVIRPTPSGGSMRATTAALVAGDTLQMINQCMQAANTMRSNAVPDINGMYNCYIDPLQLQGLFNDSAFQLLYRGAYQSREYRQGEVMEIGGIRFIPTNLAPQQTLSGLNIHRALVVGKGALIEGDFDGQDDDAGNAGNPLAEKSTVDGVTMVTRAPMDRLQQQIAQSWVWIGGFAVPTDTTTNPTTIPTASNAAYKRAIVIESL